jgi:hypothetical protein
MAEANHPDGVNVLPDGVNEFGYRIFTLGKFNFWRDEYYVHIEWPGGSHIAPVDRFLRALMRDVAWNFFYGIVNFDDVFGTANHYGTVDIFAGLYNPGYSSRNKHFVERHNSDEARTLFNAMLEDWTIEGFDPFAAPEETGTPFGPKRGTNTRAVRRARVVSKRMVGLKDDSPLRSDASGHPSIATSATSIRMSPRFTPSRASRMTFTRSISSPISRAPMSPGIRRSARSSKIASSARPPRNSRCRSSTATIA